MGDTKSITVRELIVALSELDPDKEIEMYSCFEGARTPISYLAECSDGKYLITWGSVQTPEDEYHHFLHDSVLVTVKHVQELGGDL